MYWGERKRKRETPLSTHGLNQSCFSRHFNEITLNQREIDVEFTSVPSGTKRGETKSGSETQYEI